MKFFTRVFGKRLLLSLFCILALGSSFVFLPLAAAGAGPMPADEVIRSFIKWDSIEGVLGGVIDFIFWIALIVCPLIIIIGALTFVTAGGEPAKIQTGKNMIFYALLGLSVIILAKGFVLALQTILRVKK